MVTESHFITERTTGLAAGAVAVSVLQGIVLAAGGVPQIRRNVGEKRSGYIHPNVMEGVQATQERTAEESQYRRATTSLYSTLLRGGEDTG